MKSYSFSDLVNRRMIGDESFYDCAEVDPVLEQQDARIAELIEALKQREDQLRAAFEREHLVAPDQSCMHKWTVLGAPEGTEPDADQICEAGCGQTYADCTRRKVPCIRRDGCKYLMACDAAGSCQHDEQ